jgi:hypothetical protein
MSDWNKVHIVIVYPYSTQTYETDVHISINNNQINLNEVVEEIKSNDFKIPDNTAISVWDRDLQYFIYCGLTPLDTNITIPKNNTVKFLIKIGQAKAKAGD